MYYLGIDFGTKKIGLALLEVTSGVASPLPIIKHDEKVFATLEQTLKSYKVAAIILGMPSYENTAKKVHLFAKELTDRYALPIHYVPEDNSSIAIKQQLNGKKQKQQLDSYSAVALCEQWLSDNL